MLGKPFSELDSFVEFSRNNSQPGTHSAQHPQHNNSAKRMGRAGIKEWLLRGSWVEDNGRCRRIGLPHTRRTGLPLILTQRELRATTLGSKAG